MRLCLIFCSHPPTFLLCLFTIYFSFGAKLWRSEEEKNLRLSIRLIRFLCFASNVNYSTGLHISSLSRPAEHRELPGGRLDVLVPTQQALHRIQRILHTSTRGWRTIFCLRSEGERTCTPANTAARQTYMAFGSVVAVYFFPSLLCMICLPNTCLECGGGCAARSLPVPEDARR